jgi:hypothetical protein
MELFCGKRGLSKHGKGKNQCPNPPSGPFSQESIEDYSESVESEEERTNSSKVLSSDNSRTVTRKTVTLEKRKTNGQRVNSQSSGRRRVNTPSTPTTESVGIIPNQITVPQTVMEPISQLTEESGIHFSLEQCSEIVARHNKFVTNLHHVIWPILLPLIRSLLRMICSDEDNTSYTALAAFLVLPSLVQKSRANIVQKKVQRWLENHILILEEASKTSISKY